MRTDKETYEIIENDWREILKAGDFSGFDTELVPLLKKFNEIPGLVTFMSCFGHPEVTDRPHYGEAFYITFAYTEEGFAWLQNYFYRAIELIEMENTSDLYVRSLILSCSVRQMKGRDGWWRSAGLSCPIRKNERKNDLRGQQTQQVLLRVLEKAFDQQN